MSLPALTLPMQWVFWLSVLATAYLYFGFPLLLAVLSKLFARPVRKGPVEPFVSLLIPAYNEADVIEEKLAACRRLDYPAEKIEVVVASDGSTDATCELVRPHADGARVRLLDFQQNRGKLAMLNAVVPELHGEIVVFSDAASMPSPNAVRDLASNFADPAVGAVSGVYRIENRDSHQLGQQAGFYWRYETWIKQKEAEIGSILGAHGALYAIRRELYPQLDPGVINDDFVIPLRIARAGWRVAYEPAAVAVEEAHEMGGFGRRIRIMTGNIEQLTEVFGFLWPPKQWLTLFFLLSHKAGRMFAPPAMIAALVANSFLLDQPLYQLTMAGQLGFYALAAAGGLGLLPIKALRLPYYFTMINLAALVGLLRLLTGRRAWK
ncbi:MAG: glycosyltransferase [Acidobacteria bacterium]|nr:glycosyltransferase [Acidobacteriota bacterium]